MLSDLKRFWERIDFKMLQITVTVTLQLEGLMRSALVVDALNIDYQINEYYSLCPIISALFAISCLCASQFR